MMMKLSLPLRARSFLPLAAAGLLVASCSSGGSGAKPAGNEAPSLSFTAPAAATVIEQGESVEIRWIADDSDDDARTTIVAVGLTVNATIDLVVDAPELDGVEQLFTWTPAPGQEGIYRIDGTTTDGEDAVSASAAGTVEVGAVDAVQGAAVMATGGYPTVSRAFEDGSFVVMGELGSNQPVVFDPGGPNETTLKSPQSDVFVAKFAANGDFLWARQTTSEDPNIESLQGGASPQDVVTLADGGCILSLIFSGQITLDEGGENEQTFATGDFEARELLARFDSSGGFLDARFVYETTLYAESDAGSIVRVASDSFAVMGERSGELVFDLGGANETVLPGEEGVYLAVFRESGELVFAQELFEQEEVSVEETLLAANEQGIWVAGTFTESITFALGQAGETTLTALSDEHDDLFLAYYGTDGSFRWARQALAALLDDGSGRQDAYGASLVADEVGNAYLVSQRLGAATYVVGINDPNETLVEVGSEEDAIILMRYRPDGGLDWATVIESDDFEDDESIRSRLVPLTGVGVVLSAVIDGLVHGDGFFLEVDAAPGFGQLMLACFDETGAFVWALNDGGIDESLNSAVLNAIDDERLLVVGIGGSLFGDLELGTNEAVSTILVGAEGGLMYRAVYGIDGSFTAQE